MDQRAVVGEQQQAGCVLVQPAHGLHVPMAQRRGQQAHHAGVVPGLARTFVAGRLVQHQGGALGIAPLDAIHREYQCVGVDIGPRILANPATDGDAFVAHQPAAFLAGAETVLVKDSFEVHAGNAITARRIPGPDSYCGRRCKPCVNHQCSPVMAAVDKALDEVGRIREQPRPDAIGSLERPMSDADLARKFHGLVDPVLDSARADALIAAAMAIGAASGIAPLDPAGEAEQPDRFKPEFTLYLPQEHDLAKAEASLQEAVALAGGIRTARRLVNEPANVMTPDRLAREAQALAREHGFEITVYDERQIQQMGLEAFWSVAKGSDAPPRFLVEQRLELAQPVGMLRNQVAPLAEVVQRVEAFRKLDMAPRQGGGRLQEAREGYSTTHLIIQITVAG